MSRKKTITFSNIEKMQKKGRGQGEGKQYKPWLTIRDVNSHGFKHRINGWKTGRMHHLFSNVELSFFFWLEWLPNVVDIRERFPLLPIEESISIAEDLGVKHPIDNKKAEYIVMTTDFLVNHSIQNENVLKAYSVMTTKGLNSTYVLRKTMIERAFWLRQGIEFSVITDEDIPKELANNVDWLCTAKDFEFLPIKTYKDLFVAERVISKHLYGSSLTLAKSCLLSDTLLGLQHGSSIMLVKHFIANSYWKVDLTKRLTTNKPIKFERNEKMLTLLENELVG